jgi:hypothetical protein
MSNDIINLANKTNDGTKQSPEQALSTALDDLGKYGAFEKGKKLLILALDDTDGYSVSFIQAGMKMSECLTLCEVAKTLFLSEMEYI